MKFGHEKLDVYQLALEYASRAFHLTENQNGLNRHAKDQLIRAPQSMVLNIAEGNGKGTPADRRRFFEISRGSALECAAIQDILCKYKTLTPELNKEGKSMLLRIVSMLTKLGHRKCYIQEQAAEYSDNDFDNDSIK